MANFLPELGRHRHGDTMPPSRDSQVLLTGPFLYGDVPDKDAASIHIRVHWQPYISPSEYQVLMAIYDRTTRFGKLESLFPITIQVLQTGSAPKPEEGFAGIPPVDLPERSVKRAIAGLRGMGIIHRFGRGFIIDYSTTAASLAAYSAVQRRVIATQRLSRSKLTTEQAVAFIKDRQAVLTHEGATLVTRATIVTPPECHSTRAGANINTSKHNSLTHIRAREEVEGEVMVKQFDNIGEALSFTRDRKEATRQKREARAKLNITDYGRVFQDHWHSAMRQRFPKMVVVPWSQSRVIPHLKRSVLIPAKDADIVPGDLATFIVRRWQAIRKRYFGWMKNYPEKPEVEFVFRNAAKFFEAFASGLDEGEPVASDAETLAEENRKLRVEATAAKTRLREIENTTMSLLREQDAQIKTLRRRIKRKPAPKGVMALSYEERMGLKEE